jgi:hypothetical protein
MGICGVRKFIRLCGVKSPKLTDEGHINPMRFVLFFCLGILTFPAFCLGQEINRNGWPVPDLKGLTPYNITIKVVDGVEKIVETFYTPQGGHVARIRGNGKVFAYAVDSDQDPPIDYLILDPDGAGKFTWKFKSDESYKIPEWVSY